MAENEREALQDLLNTLISELKEGEYWTERRDTAEFLAEAAKRIVTTIQDVAKKGDDVDVRIGCERALNDVRELLKLQPVRVEAPPPTAAPPATVLAPESPAPAQKERASLADMVREDLAGPDVTVAETADGYELIVKLEGGRQQTVYVAEEHDEKQGLDLIRIFTVCAPANSSAFKWSLETNSKLTHGAIAIRRVGGKEVFVIADTHPAEMVGREHVREAVFSIAEIGDTVEKGMTRADKF
jgi:hypothetical protein